MTLQTTGAISANDINIELGLGGTTQWSINDSINRDLADVPSGQISFDDFYGKSDAPTLTWPGLSNINITDTEFNSTAQASISFLETGDINYVPGHPSPPDWLDPVVTGFGAGYSMYYTLVSGTFTSSAMAEGVVVNLGSTRSFTVTRVATGVKSCTADFFIYPTGAAGPYQSRRVSLSAENAGGGGSILA